MLCICDEAQMHTSAIAICCTPSDRTSFLMMVVRQFSTNLKMLNLSCKEGSSSLLWTTAV